MKIDTLLKFKEPFDKFRDVESKLLSRNAKGKIAGWGALLSAMVQAIILLSQDDMLKQIIGLFTQPLEMNLKVFIPTLFIIAGLLVYFLVKRTSFLLKETKEPFRYTFWVDPFSRIDETPADRFELKAIDRIKLMHHDLIELIHQRIKRFSILEEPAAEETRGLTDTRSTSHIYIHGHYAIREDRENKEWIIHVMPFVRIGPKGSAETLAQTVRFPLIDEFPDTLDTEEYNQLLERVYSRVTTEIYARIEKDIEKKITLFPTAYLQANALYIEASDMAASNTINAFESAIKLYQAAIRKIELTLKYTLSGYFLRIPVLKSFFTRYLQQYARIQIGHAQCLVYKNRIASLSGRKSNALFEIKQNLKKTTTQLEKFHLRLGSNKSIKGYRNDRKTYSILTYLSFPKDSLSRLILMKPGRKVYNETCAILFHSYIVLSLADSLTGSYKSARKNLDKARAVAPDLSISDVLFYLAEAYCESDIDKALMIFQHASEIEPSFQIARYDLAFWMEMKFRTNGEITPERARSVIHEYEKVLQINPGNIAALTAQGNILWLIHDLKKARRKFDEGCNLKAIVSETFIAQLLYGKARVAAEEGKSDESIDLFNQAIANNPNVGAYSMNNEKGITVTYYDYITFDLVRRYREYHEKVAKTKIRSAGLNEKVLSFVLNDLANACINYYIRFGNEDHLNEAIATYEEAIRLNPSNIVAVYNNSNALTFLNDQGGSDKSIRLLKQVTESNPRWLEALTSSIELIQQECFRKIRDARTDVNSLQQKINDINEKTARQHLTSGTSLSRETPTRGAAPANTLVPDSLMSMQANQQEKQRLLEKIDKLEKEITIQKNRLYDLKPLIRKIFETSKLISLYDGLRLDRFEASSVTAFTQLKIDWVRLDLEDVRAVRNYAISYYYNIPDAVDAQSDQLPENKSDFSDDIPDQLTVCKTLINHLRSYYYEEDFVMIRILQELLLRKNNEKLFGRLLFRQNVHRRQISLLNENTLPGEIWGAFIDENIQVRDYTLEKLKEDPTAWLLRNKSDGYEWRYKLIVKGRKLEVFRHEAEECDELIGASIRFWNGEDPIHWNYLNWAERYLPGEEYKELLQKSLLNSSNPILLNQLGIIHFDNLEYDEALSCFTRVLEKDDTKPVHHFRLGNTYGKLKDWEHAFSHLMNAVIKRRTVTADPNTLYYYYNELLTAYQEKDIPEEFIEFLEKSGDLLDNPEKLALLYNRVGTMISDKENWKLAKPLYLKAMELDAGKPIYCSNLALMYTNLGEWDAARELYSRAVKLRKYLADDLYTLEFYYGQFARLYYICDKVEAFFYLLENSGDFDGNDEIIAGFHNSIGVMYSTDNEFEKSMPYFRKAAELDPEKAIYSSNLALMHSNLKEWDQATEQFKLTLDLVNHVKDESYGPDYYYSLAVDAFFQAGKLDEFLALIEKAEIFRLNPAPKGLVYNRVGNLYANTNNDPDNAILYYQKAISSDPTRPIFYCNLGLMYMNLKDWDTAWSNFKNSIQYRRQSTDDTYGFDYYFGLSVDSYFMTERLEDFLQQPEMNNEEQISREYKAVIFNQVGNLYSRKGLPMQAIPYYRDAIKMDDKKPIYHSNLGLMFQDMESWKEAIMEFEEAIKMRRLAPMMPLNLIIITV